MKKQYIKPFTKAHTLNAEQPILAGSYRVRATDNDKTQSEGSSSDNNYGIDTKWDWGNGNGSGVD